MEPNQSRVLASELYLVEKWHEHSGPAAQRRNKIFQEFVNLGMRARWSWHARAERQMFYHFSDAEKDILECRDWPIRSIAGWIGQDLRRVMVTDQAHPMKESDLQYRTDWEGDEMLVCVYEGDPYDVLPELAYSCTAFDDPDDVEEARRFLRDQSLWVSGVYWRGNKIVWVDEYGIAIREKICDDRKELREGAEAFEQFRPFESPWWVEATKSYGSGVNLLPTGTCHLIDSTVPHIWLPDDAIQAFVDNLGLTYDNKTDLFLNNDTMRQQMLSLEPTVTFVLSTSLDGGTGSTQNIELPYVAFDLQVSYPFYQNATNYFPIRRAANDSQYNIGRAFLQEAYLIPDYDCSNFTIAQAAFPASSMQQLVAIEAPIASNGSNGATVLQSSTSSVTLSTGAIAEIVVAAVVVLACVCALTWYFLRQHKHRHTPLASSEPDEIDGDYTLDKKGHTAYAHHGSELPSESGVFEVPEQVKRSSELAVSASPGVEVQGDLGKFRSRPGMFEMPSEEDRRYELPGSNVREDGER